jgi:hypothetical protein
VGVQQEADLEQFGDFDNDPGPDGIGGSGPGFVDGVGPPCAGSAAALAQGVAGYDDTGSSGRDPGPGPAGSNLDYNSDTAFGCIDHILTNSPSITAASVARLDGQGGGLWASDHAGLLSRLKIPGGKRKK